jgi:RsiW-degrading membrane proteinase PrsW (M82 family)
MLRLLMSLLIVANLLLCAIGIVWLIYRYDMYDKEPWYMLGLAGAVGYLFMHLTHGPQIWAIRSLEPLLSLDRSIALVAAVFEEGAKLMVVVMVAALFRTMFNDPMDGIIYGSLAGLGAALNESVGLLGELEGPIPATEIIRLFGHGIMGGLTGFGVGLYTIAHRGRHAALLAALAGSMLLHYLWDVLALGQIEPNRRTSVVACMLMLSGLFAYGWAVSVARELSRQRFNPAHHHRLLGWPLFRRHRRPPSAL